MDNITVKSFSSAVALSTVALNIDGFRKGDPNIRVRIPDPYSRTTEEGREI